MSKLDEREAFFYEHAGYSYRPGFETPEEGRKRCAHALAMAEITGEAFGWEVRWEVEPDPMWDDDVEREHTDYDQWWAVLEDEDGEHLGSLGCIDLGPSGYPDGPGADPYARVIAAELMLEARQETYYRRGGAA